MKKLLLAALLAAAPFAAAAGDLSYTYVEGGLSRLDINTSAYLGEDVEFDGAYLRGSVAFSDSFYGFGGISRGRNDDYGMDIDATETQLGVGYALGMTDRADFIAELGYINRDLEGIEGDGARASVGLRGLLGERAEGWVKAGYTDGGDFDGDFIGQLGLLVKFNPTWGAVGEIESEDGVKRFSIGVRASF